MKVICLGCGYRFETKGTKSQCPYCGEYKKLSELENAEDLV
jgi:rubrerythrin